MGLSLSFPHVRPSIFIFFYYSVLFLSVFFTILCYSVLFSIYHIFYVPLFFTFFFLLFIIYLHLFYIVGAITKRYNFWLLYILDPNWRAIFTVCDGLYFCIYISRRAFLLLLSRCLNDDDIYNLGFY